MRDVCGEFLGFANCAGHPFAGRCEDQFRTKEAQQIAPLHTHGVGHGQDNPIAPGCGNKGEGDAGVAAGRLDDDTFGTELAGPLRGRDHIGADTIFHAAQGIEEFQLGIHLGSHILGEAIEPH